MFLYGVLQTGLLALRNNARLHHEFFALKSLKYNARRKLPLRIQLQRTCLIVVRRSVSWIYCRCSDHSHDLLSYCCCCCCCCCMCYAAAAGTGPLVLDGSALLLDEPASAGLRSNMLVIFREAEVAFFGCKGPRVLPWLTRCCFVSTALWTPSLGAELTVEVRHGDMCWRCFHDSEHAWV